MSDLNLLNLIANGTMSAQIAALLSAIGAEQRSFLVAALPRLAGKSTVAEAILQCAPEGTLRHDLSGDITQMHDLAAQGRGGYIIVAEFAPGDRGSYLGGDRARLAIDTARAGYSIAGTLHADSIEEAYDALHTAFGASDEQASVFDYLVYIKRFGDGPEPQNYWRRVAGVYELERVVDGKPEARQLFDWDSASDTFDSVEQPRLLVTSPDVLEERTRALQALVDSGSTAFDEMTSVVS
jgi:hypothetical protein